VGYISRFMENPTTEHLGAVRKVLRYIAGTLDYGCLYTREKGGSSTALVTMTTPVTLIRGKVLQLLCSFSAGMQLLGRVRSRRWLLSVHVKPSTLQAPQLPVKGYG
jgi:hypothetical protein